MCVGLHTMECTLLTRRPFKYHIYFYLQSAQANGKVKSQDERQRERERDGGRAGKTLPQQDALHRGRLQKK